MRRSPTPSCSRCTPPVLSTRKPGAPLLAAMVLVVSLLSPLSQCNQPTGVACSLCRTWSLRRPSLPMKNSFPCFSFSVQQFTSCLLKGIWLSNLWPQLRLGRSPTHRASPILWELAPRRWQWCSCMSCRSRGLRQMDPPKTSRSSSRLRSPFCQVTTPVPWLEKFVIVVPSSMQRRHTAFWILGRPCTVNLHLFSARSPFSLTLTSRSVWARRLQAACPERRGEGRERAVRSKPCRSLKHACSLFSTFCQVDFLHGLCGLRFFFFPGSVPSTAGVLLSLMLFASAPLSNLPLETV